MHRGSSRNGSRNNMSNEQPYLEQENDRLVDGLHAKTKALKSLTIDIGNEVKEQNRLLDETDTDFEGSRNLLGSTMRRLGLVSNSGGHRFMCYLVLFALAVFGIIYYLVSASRAQR